MNQLGPESTTLLAVYDLSVAPATFDVVNFLLLAEIDRRKRGLASLHVVFVAAEDGESADGFDPAARDWRLRHVLMPACRLMPSCAGISICGSRDEAQTVLACGNAVFPDGYSVDLPADRFQGAELVAAGACGYELPSLVPQEQALRYARRWIDEHGAGRKAVAITLREAGYGTVRNSDVSAWRAFIDTLDRDVYFPFVIRDTDKSFDDVPLQLRGIAQCPIAAVNLEFRAALYQECYLNLFTGSGAAELCKHNERARYLIIRLFNPAWHDTTRESIVGNFGIEIGEQFPFATPFQRLIWEPETADNIRGAFDDMVARIEAASAAAPSGTRRYDVADPMRIARRLEQCGFWRPAKTIYRHLLARDPAHPEARAALDAPESDFHIGLMHQIRKQHGLAVVWFERALSGDPRNALFLTKLAFSLHALGRAEESVAACERALAADLDGSEACVVKALALAALSRLDDAIACCEAAIERSPDAIEAYDVLADLLRLSGRTDAAIQAMQRAQAVRSGGMRTRA